MDSSNKKKQSMPIQRIICLFAFILILLGSLLLVMVSHEQEAPTMANDVGIMDGFDFIISDALSEAEHAARSVRKRFWLDDDVKKGPVPNPESYGSTSDPSTLQWLLDEADPLLEGQKTLFSIETPLIPNTEATYYLDDSIFAVTWKQPIDRSVYTITEVKVSHPSQFRRHLEDSVFDGPKLSTPTKMARNVNAVVGTSADHYRGRKAGIVVYDGEVKRMHRLTKIDVCYIDVSGDLHFSYAGEIMDKETADKFVADNDISFSLSFGPVLIDNGVRCEPANYNIGEINDNYARTAICQMGPLHYLVVVANAERGYMHSPDLHEFAAVLDTFGCKKAYTLDGGNTGSIVMNGRLINRTPFGYERSQGDIIYFCTAVPDHKN